jgi:hypothetical protein
MNLAAVEKIARAVLYEGYMLYPYRPSSVKNRQRWNFGVLCPRGYSEAQQGTEAWTMQTECLAQGDSETRLEVRVRFLQLAERSVAELLKPASELPPHPEFRAVPRLAVNGRVYRPWQEALEREIILPASSLGTLARGPIRQEFFYPAVDDVEPIAEPDHQVVGVVLRKRQDLRGEVEVRAKIQNQGLFQLTVVIQNTTPFPLTHETNRDEALSRALVSTHTVLEVEKGKLISLIAPPDSLSRPAAECRNVGTWPVLIGEEGDGHTMLAAPIILYDYPQIAPESAQDLFDGTEIDEILSLRIMTLTEDEKREMRQSDERARQMLERTEAMPAEQFMKLHGVLRGLRPLKEVE